MLRRMYPTHSEETKHAGEPLGRSGATEGQSPGATGRSLGKTAKGWVDLRPRMILYRQQVVIVITIKPVQAAGGVGRICG